MPPRRSVQDLTRARMRVGPPTRSLLAAALSIEIAELIQPGEWLFADEILARARPDAAPETVLHALYNATNDGLLTTRQRISRSRGRLRRQFARVDATGAAAPLDARPAPSHHATDDHAPPSDNGDPAAMP